MRAHLYGLGLAVGLLAGTAVAGGNDSVVILGAVYNLTGDQAGLDVPSARGARLAVDQRNREGGLLEGRVRLRTANGKSDPQTLARKAEALLDRFPDLAAVFGLSATDMVLAAGPVVAADGRVFLTSGATSPRLPAEIPEFLFLACFGDNVQAAAGAEWAREELDARTVAILYDTRHSYTRLLQGYFETRFEQVGGTVVAKEGFASDDLSSAIARIGRPDLVYLAAETPEDALNGVRQLRSAGITSPILGGDGYDSATAWEQAPEIGDVYYTTHAYLGPDNADPTVTAFREAFEAAYAGAEPDSFAALGYDAASLLMVAVEIAGSDDPSAVRDALGQIEGFEGVTGTISYTDGSRIPTKSVSIIGIGGGELHLVEELTPERVPTP